MHEPYLKKPILTKHIESFCTSDFALTSAEMQGWRKTMEDTKIFMELADEVYIFGVFDGHGGPEVAHYVAEMLPKEILNEPYFKLKNYGKALINAFQRIDELICSERGEKHLLRINQDLHGAPVGEEESISCRAGCTANVILMTKDKYFTANIGDSRAVLCRNGDAVTLSYDHKPDHPSEKERVENAGGYVFNGRINGQLNLSRSFGDFQHKQFSKKAPHEQPIISVPDVIEIERKKQDRFILMGCDGVWEKFVSSNQKMVNHVKKYLGESKDKRVVMANLFDSLVAKSGKDIDGCDNMTALLIELL